MTNNIDFTLEQNITMEPDDDDTLIIKGVASDTTTDRYDENLTTEALESLVEQATGINMHWNHTETIIGVNTSAELINGQLIVKTKILPEYATKLREQLEFGINYGESIGGIATINDGTITDFDLLEISLTDSPANPSTYATVTIAEKNYNSCCIGGICNIMENKNMKEEKAVEIAEAPVSQETGKEKTYVTAEELANALAEQKSAIITEFKSFIDEFKEAHVDESIEDVEESIKSIEYDAGEIGSHIDSALAESSARIQEAIDNKFSAFEEKYFQNKTEARSPESKIKNAEKTAPTQSKKGLTTKELANAIVNGGIFNE